MAGSKVAGSGRTMLIKIFAYSRPPGQLNALCSTVRIFIVWYGMVWYGMVWCGMVWYGMVCYAMLCYVMLCYVMLCYVMLWYAMLC